MKYNREINCMASKIARKSEIFPVWSSDLPPLVLSRSTAADAKELSSVSRAGAMSEPAGFQKAMQSAGLDGPSQHLKSSAGRLAHAAMVWKTVADTRQAPEAFEPYDLGRVSARGC
jgi:hypothetical protein